jgi:hypothetical protein
VSKIDLERIPERYGTEKKQEEGQLTRPRLILGRGHTVDAGRCALDLFALIGDGGVIHELSS